MENADSQLFCSRCGVGQQESLLLRCSACESAYYCDELCQVRFVFAFAARPNAHKQKSHWRYHKPHCNTPLPGDEVEAQPARLRVFGRFMHNTADGAATAYRKAMQLLGSKETIATTDVEGNGMKNSAIKQCFNSVWAHQSCLVQCNSIQSFCKWKRAAKRVWHCGNITFH